MSSGSLPERKQGLQPPVAEVDHPATLSGAAGTAPPPPAESPRSRRQRGGAAGRRTEPPGTRPPASTQPPPSRGTPSAPRPHRGSDRDSDRDLEWAAQQLLALGREPRTQMSARMPETVARNFPIYCRIRQIEQQVLLPQLMIAEMARNGYWPPPWDEAQPSTQ